MWRIWLVLCFASAVHGIDGADESTKSEMPPVVDAVPKVSRIYIDTLANEYIAVEKALWTKIETQQLLVDRGQLLDEIYREHKHIIGADFGQHATIWSLGLQRHAKIFNDILAINTNAQNIKEYIFAEENDKAVELAQNAHEQMEKTATEFYQLITDKSFWENIIYNVSDFASNTFFVFAVTTVQILRTLFDSGGQRSMQEAHNGPAQCKSADFRCTQ